MNDAVAAALSYFDSVDPALAADARAGWDGLVDVSPPSGPTQHSVQEFLWAHLRVAYTAERATDIADALGELLGRLGHARYADIARSPATRLLVTIDDGGWPRAYSDALADSGIGASDTELVTWSDEPAEFERGIVDLIGDTLEVATVAGEFDPVRPGAAALGKKALATRRRGLTDAVLRSDRGNGVVLEQLLDHRIELWSAYSTPRAELCAGIELRLHEAEEPAFGCVRRLEGVLRLVGDGVDLTDTGYLPPEVVHTALTTLWSPAEWPFPSGLELDTSPVLTIRRLLLKLRLVRKNRGRLVPTARSKQLSTDGLWRVMVAGIVGSDYHPESIAAEVVLGDIVRGKPLDESVDRIRAVLSAEGWSHGGVDADDAALKPLGESVVDDVTALGAFDVDGRPTEAGRRLAAAILRYRLLHTRLPVAQ